MRNALWRAPVSAVLPRAVELSPEIRVLVTVHPSYLLRVPDEQHADEYRKFVADLALAAPFVKSRAAV